MKRYIYNNIDFRIVSAKSIANFKECQAFDFNELVKNEKDFSSQSKEALLLEYEHLFKFILRLERLFLLYSKESNLIIKDELINNLYNAFDDIDELEASYTDIFSTELRQFIRLAHHYYFNILVQEIMVILETIDPEEATVAKMYPKLVNLITDYLQALLINLYEFEYNTNNNTGNFLCFTKLDAFSLTGNSEAFAKKLEFYNKFGSEFFDFKNYSERDIPEVTKQLTENR